MDFAGVRVDLGEVTNSLTRLNLHSFPTGTWIVLDLLNLRRHLAAGRQFLEGGAVSFLEKRDRSDASPICHITRVRRRLVSCLIPRVSDLACRGG